MLFRSHRDVGIAALALGGAGMRRRDQQHEDGEDEEKPCAHSKSLRADGPFPFESLTPAGCVCFDEIGALATVRFHIQGGHAR